jgi:hypothetical protein
MEDLPDAIASADPVYWRRAKIDHPYRLKFDQGETVFT